MKRWRLVLETEGTQALHDWFKKKSLVTRVPMNQMIIKILSDYVKKQEVLG